MFAQTVADATAWLSLALRPGVPPRAQHRLLGHFHTPHEACRAREPQVARLCGAEVAAAFAAGPLPGAVEATLRWLEDPAHHLVTIADDEYPRALFHIADPPLIFHAHGRLELLHAQAIAIVGSRNATPRGLRDAEEFAEALSAHGLCIVSGMARGIDGAAHRGALRQPGSSVAVLGTGIDLVYPPGHEALAQSLASQGCLVSEYPLGLPPLPGNFPQRNRLISGLVRGVVVMEANAKSGSLITARYAAHQGRDVFAVPGSIHSALSKGAHLLLKEGAALVECAADVLQEYGLAPHARTGSPVAAGDAAPHPLLEAMGFAPVFVDELVGLVQLPSHEVAAQLVGLALQGRVKELGGGRYQRLTGHAGAAL